MKSELNPENELKSLKLVKNATKIKNNSIKSQLNQENESKMQLKIKNNAIKSELDRENSQINIIIQFKLKIIQ